MIVARPLEYWRQQLQAAFDFSAIRGIKCASAKQVEKKGRSLGRDAWAAMLVVQEHFLQLRQSAGQQAKGVNQ